VSAINFFSFASHGYLGRELALLESIRKFYPEARTIFCSLDSVEDRVNILGEVESVDYFRVKSENPDSASGGKSFSEQLFTYMPLLTKTALNRVEPGELLIYLDSDIELLSKLDDLVTEMDGYSVGLFPHNYSFRTKSLSTRYGMFNAGAILVRNDPLGHDFLAKWSSLAFEWCYDKPEAGKYAHQAYLNELQNESGVKVIKSTNYNSAPWNASSLFNSWPARNVGRQDQRCRSGFYHHQGLRLVTGWYISGHFQYGTLPSSEEREVIRRYVESNTRIQKDFGLPFSMPRDSGALRFAAVRALALAYSWITGGVFRKE
jgi:hypothetical protein